ncbi:uncharacterized protein ACBT57_008631 isoform 1-T1 [Dama dama]
MLVKCRFLGSGSALLIQILWGGGLEILVLTDAPGEFFLKELCFYEESTVTFQINVFPCLARKIMKNISYGTSVHSSSGTLLNAVKVLHSYVSKFGKLSSGHRTGKGAGKHKSRKDPSEEVKKKISTIPLLSKNI